MYRRNSQYPTLMERFDSVVNHGGLSDVVNEIVRQSKVEFNMAEDECA